MTLLASAFLSRKTLRVSASSSDRYAESGPDVELFARFVMVSNLVAFASVRDPISLITWRRRRACWRFGWVVMRIDVAG